MRIRLLYLLASLGLTGCAYYGDIHSHSQPLTPQSLSAKNVYKPTTARADCEWWRKFKDPELNLLENAALSNSPDMKAAEYRVRRANEIAKAVGSELWPTLDLSGYIERERFSQYGLIPPPFNGGTYNIETVGLNFNYEFDFWGERRQAYAAQLNERCAAAADAAQARLVLSAAVANTYFALLANIAQKQLAKTSWEVDQKILRIAATRARHGIESDIPVKTIEANIQSSLRATEQYHQAEMLARHQLAVLLGNNPLSTTIVTRPFVFKEHHISLPRSLPASLLAQRPDIHAAKLRAEAAANEVNVAKARFFPNINLSGLFSYQSIISGKLFSPRSQNNAVTGAFDLPIFDAGLRRANLGVNYAEYDLAVNDYNKTILAALREVVDQSVTLRALHAQMRAQSTAVSASQRNYKLSYSRYNHGIDDYVYVLQSKQMLLQQQSTQLDLQTHHLQAVVAMLKALGGNDSPGVMS